MDDTQHPQDFYKLLTSYPTEYFFSNIHATVKLLTLNQYIFTIIIKDLEDKDSYVCSPFNAFIYYVQDELMPSNMLLAGLAKGGLWCLKHLFIFCNLNKNIYINNLLLATDVYGKWQGTELAQVVQQLREQYPEHAIIFRSITSDLNGDLEKNFLKNNFYDLAFRKVYSRAH